MTKTKQVNQTDASPVCVANNHSPELPLVERTYAFISNDSDRFTQSSMYSFFSTPLHFIRPSLSSPMALIAELDEDVQTPGDSVFDRLITNRIE